MDGSIQGVARHLRAQADALADAVLARVQADSPGDGGAATPDAATLRNLRLGARAAVDFFLARLDADGGQAPDTSLFVAHGRAQQAAGRSLSELLAFYRLGGLAMWEGAQAIPVSRTLPQDAIFALGAEVLETVDRLSVAAVEGFTAQEAETLRLELARRDRLVSLLLSDRPSGADQLAAAAGAAAWTLPARVRVAVAALPADPPPGSGLAGPARVLTATVDGGRRALVVADDEECERWLLRAARAQQLEAPLAVGPAVAPAHAARSLRRATALLEQAPASVDGVLRCDDHEIDLLLGAAPELARAIVARRLDAFEALPAAQRERLLETLRGWLAHPARPQAIADELGVHVQTVRYRLRQLRDLLGDALDDPEARFELSVALRARSLSK
ncbi:helix-turn-helix domain-containing protein [Conexibacter stalactiti]|uniref:Helix-turn-helix domain-containing protein n=1 Tax=Conexibacter stalactiti TaxID=1940611 RepID=A0ABU4HIX8_9ACTN|nr:helix-turn-helix domain-containing protein [Conexibacter stalactiti]MDW5593217.1 helix-turn-helix domain-containing protein [Conexibacter stalactiti]MEC5033858.1 helix-turn-helix domain-containing protein [Conexibacter stalactiti]